ncbi:type III-B CRISPR module RAMP protein Cmr4 [Aliarcobacter butzleri]|uniref:type III-B CRISPR module RAMP protein Cmr4 n=1 Tax=Aliarcobacter butzleri TaxID=28197 RepID=UPI00125EC69B|nr:type III-B CRISPR module RAMP protein Cmr4 [Aliarcobacter butzleri]MCT7550866.1 type III-B CRISPR module RAMP protein Cmr4 [Aliarcobacter butzleri]MCT7559003.1 type III-B CRISPR module RAMP protein Cmr4 [Aliarcobacter butzleri]MCT7594410.1 type III-B CRISPR module RAMP protein Cmr4 [Aliarcobacter butzleri]MCT7599034.1 type III-B CRISPR module RAMP protein Cmr4 [Aliarcobacter butzleri]MCT7625829.1 type III-B CRISPR module RAMP protein Cmr4 [Aliarcobacter butzleri]
MYKNEAYIIKTKTNLHVGSGDTNFGIVDKQVQRDSITNLPVINASSLKGAIKDHFADLLAQTNDLPIDSDFVKPFVFRTVFGDEQKELDSDDTKTYNKLPKQGLVKFIDAKLLFLPLRSNKKPYFHVTSIETLKNAKDFLNNFAIKLDLDELNAQNKSVVISNENAIIEDVECSSYNENKFEKIKKLFGIENLAIFNDEDFNEAVSNLPVIARNKLDNGKSENLWYEEVLPRESILYTVFCYYDNLDDSSSDSKGKTDKKKFEMAYKLFKEKLLKDNIQIGANASIGYGITKFSKIGDCNE